MRASKKAPKKRILAAVVAIVLAMGMMPVGAWAADTPLTVGAEQTGAAAPIDVYMTVSNQGTLALAREQVTVADLDKNGSITLDEALKAAHEQYYPGGIDGYATVVGEWGYQVTKLWGVDSTSNGFYKNDMMTNSVDYETVAAGDDIVAYVMADQSTWSDCYACFDKKTLTVAPNEQFTLTLKADNFGTPVDASGVQVGTWKDGVFTKIDGKVTDSDSKVTLSLDKPGIFVVSANGVVKENPWGQTNCPICAPVCIVSVKSATTGWVKEDGKWYYFGSDGVAQTGWLKDGGEWYFLGSDGAMVTGWLKDGGEWYYLGSDGAMVTGWQKISGSWYYMKSSGAMSTGWVKDAGTWYFMKDSGAMATGWVKDGDTWYYMQASGAMATGWAKISGSWYYFKSSGAMATGWVKDGGKWYYMDANGHMVTGTVTIDGKTYKFDSSGAWIG